MEEIDNNENINNPEFYTPIIQLKYDSDDSIRSAAELAEVLRDNLILIKKDRHEEDWDNTFSSDDDTIYPTTGKYKEMMKKSLSNQLIDENDEYMDDIIAGLYKR